MRRRKLVDIEPDGLYVHAFNGLNWIFLSTRNRIVYFNIVDSYPQFNMVSKAKPKWQQPQKEKSKRQ